MPRNKKVKDSFEFSQCFKSSERFPKIFLSFLENLNFTVGCVCTCRTVQRRAIARDDTRCMSTALRAPSATSAAAVSPGTKQARRRPRRGRIRNFVDVPTLRRNFYKRMKWRKAPRSSLFANLIASIALFIYFCIYL